jgi:hypothetical protein
MVRLCEMESRARRLDEVAYANEKCLHRRRGLCQEAMKVKGCGRCCPLVR